MFFGAIADDYTGGSDLAGMLAERGVRTLMHFGVPDAPLHGSYDAAVVCLKSRSIPAAEARAMSARALEWLQAAGARQIQFKYLTFDSPPLPETSAPCSTSSGLHERPHSVVCRLCRSTAMPVSRPPLRERVPLAESPMRHHPLNR
jgi:uncharacterized protein YgbK (DUF1537 family)